MALGQVTVDLDELVNTDGFDIREAIVESAVKEIVASLRRDMYEQMQERVKAQIRASIDVELQKVFEKVLTPTDSYGTVRPGAQPMTLVEVVVKQAESYLAEKVNDRGEKPGYSDRKMTRAQFFVGQISKEFVEKQFAPQVKEAQAAVKAQIGDKLAETFKQALANCAKF